MKVTGRWSRLAAALVVAAVAGCGPSSNPNSDASGAAGANGGGGGGGSAGAPSGDVFTWKESGTLHTATLAGASLVKGGPAETMTIIGGDASGTAVTLGLSTPAPPLTPGSFDCGAVSNTEPTALMSYTNNDSSQIATCTIVLSTLGDTTGSRATGTFSGTVPLKAGGSATITNGVFDVTLTVNNL
jgi:hypothetical protein